MNAFPVRVEHESEEEKRDKQRVKRADLQVFQILQRQIDYRVAVRIIGDRMSEPAPGFETRADISEADDIVARRNTWKQSDRH